VATETNLYIDQGTDFLKTETVGDGSGTLADLEGYVVKSQMRKYYGSSSGYTFTGGIFSMEDSMIYISMDKDQTRDIPAGRYLYDIEITSPDGERIRVLEGVVTVTPEITKI
jgi:deoxyribose-phosphate aldolase